MFYLKYVFIVTFIILAFESNAATIIPTATPEEETFTRNLVNCSRIILEFNFDSTKNVMVAADQALMSLNLLACLPSNGVLKGELKSNSLFTPGEIFKDYREFLERGGFVKLFNAFLIIPMREADLPIGARIDGVDIYPILESGKENEISRYINGLVSKSTDGKIEDILQPHDLLDSRMISLTAYYYKLLWDIPFKEEKKGSFETVKGSKEITYLVGTIRASYLPSTNGEIISLPLKGGGEYVIFKPKGASDAHPFLDFLKSLGSSSNFYTTFRGATKEIARENIFLKLPKLSIESYINIKETLKKAGFEGLDKAFFEDKLSLDGFYQKNILKTTLEGIEVSAFSIFKIPLCAPVPINIDIPYYCAIVVPLPDGSYVPILIGYIGDPTLTKSEDLAPVGLPHGGAGAASH